MSGWRLTVDQESVETLAVQLHDPWRATFVGRAAPRPGRVESTLLVRRDRFVGCGMREDVVVENLSSEPAAFRLVVHCAADFADLFEVKESRVPARPSPDIVGRRRRPAHRAHLRRPRVAARASRSAGTAPPRRRAGSSSTSSSRRATSGPAASRSSPWWTTRPCEPRFPTDRPLEETVAAPAHHAVARGRAQHPDLRPRPGPDAPSGPAPTSARCASSTPSSPTSPWSPRARPGS